MRSLFPGSNDSEIAEKLADFFNCISHEFDPLSDENWPDGERVALPVLERHEVSARIKKFRKPKSMVKGDIFPDLMTLFSNFLAIPLTDIYNKITATFCWPAVWKEEFVTIIPKKSHPQSLNDLRNISCTMLA